MSHIEIAKQSASGSLVLFLGNVLSTIISAAAAIVIARLLSPGPYGIYSLALVIPSIFYTLTGMGVNLAITRYPAYLVSKGETDRAKSMTRNALTFLVLMGTLLTIIVYLWGNYMTKFLLHRSDVGPYTQVASLVVLGQILLQTCISAFIGWHSTRLASLVSVLQSMLKLGLSTVLILMGFGIYGAIAGHVAGYVGAGLVGVLILYATTLGIRQSGRAGFFGEIKEMIRYGLPPYVGGAISGLAGQYLTIILALIATNVVVGYYQAAINVTAALTVVSSAITNSLFAGFSSLDGVRGDTNAAFRYAVKYVSFVSIPIIMFLVAGAQLLMQVLYGQAYLGGSLYLQLLALSNAPVVIGLSVTPTFFNGVGRTKLTMVFSLSGALTLVLVAPFLGSFLSLGPSGLIYAQLASNILSAGVGLYLARTLGARMEGRPSLSILIASVMALGADWIMPGDLPVPVLLALYLVAFVFVYLTAVPLLRGLGHHDLDRLNVASEGFGVLKRVAHLIIVYERWLLLLTGVEYSTTENAE